ncbi:sporulation protein YjcZ [Ammoniphilus sp. CFH 90114]|nr:sporulation protein YjcZ [Ammoniphilus sp. CFH 90114]RXT06536.1 sporulation protein YjcZ [Ammoniphilus sp. CFH 90114]
MSVPFAGGAGLGGGLAFILVLYILLVIIARPGFVV